MMQWILLLSPRNLHAAECDRYLESYCKVSTHKATMCYDVIKLSSTSPCILTLRQDPPTSSRSSQSAFVKSPLLLLLLFLRPFTIGLKIKKIRRFQWLAMRRVSNVQAAQRRRQDLALISRYKLLNVAGCRLFQWMKSWGHDMDGMNPVRWIPGWGIDWTPFPSPSSGSVPRSTVGRVRDSGPWVLGSGFRKNRFIQKGKVAQLVDKTCWHLKFKIYI